MQIKLTQRWKRNTRSLSSTAKCGPMDLECYCPVHLTRGKRTWTAWVCMSTSSGPQRSGEPRTTEKAARQDAERLVVELLRDIRDSTRVLMDYFDVREND